MWHSPECDFSGQAEPAVRARLIPTDVVTRPRIDDESLSVFVLGDIMSADLTVETDLIRQAAAVIDEASMTFDDGGQANICSPLHDGSLGPSAVAREVAGAASRRVEQVLEAAMLLADHASQTADRLRAAADAFEAAESSAIRPPR